MYSYAPAHKRGPTLQKADISLMPNNSGVVIAGMDWWNLSKNEN